MKSKSSSETVAGCLVLILLMPFMAALQGWALSVLWSWFVVTTLHLPPLTVWQAFGLVLVATLFVTPQSKTGSDDKDWSDHFATVCGRAGGLLLLVGIGWMVYHWGMGL